MQTQTPLSFDEVMEVQPVGELDMYDFTVPGTHCFFANGVLVHNSGDIEQDADTIILLHRPELSQPGQRVGEMVVMVAKCRQLGQIGTVKLKWEPRRRMYFEEETWRTAPEEERRMEL